MYRKLIINDVLKNRLITLIITAFIAVAVLLISLAAILAVTLAGSVDTLMANAKTPHFLQMHSGELNHDRLNQFAKNNDSVKSYTAAKFLNIDGNDIIINHESLAKSALDIGLSVQNEQFDYLLDLDNTVIRPKQGEIYLPLLYLTDGTAHIGDTVVIAGKTLRVGGFLRDSQMNSTLASSKRLLVSQADYDTIAKVAGEPEYLIEFRLDDASHVGAFETAYSSAGLESNGPTITYSLFRTVNAFSDGLVVAMLLFVSMLVVTVALLCVHLTLMTKIDQDYHEIGVMKAIGIRISDIKKMYMAKYIALTAIGALIGYGLSFVLQNKLVENIKLYMGSGDTHGWAPIVSSVSVVIVSLLIITYIYYALGRIKKISSVKAVRQDTSTSDRSGARWFRLSRNRLLPVNVFIGIKDVLSQLKLHLVLSCVFIVSVFIFMLPFSLYATLSDKSFVNHMGVSDTDIRIDIQQVDDVTAKTNQIMHRVTNDPAVKQSNATLTKSLTVLMSDGTKSSIKIELGDHARFQPHYISGGSPSGDAEIAVSVLLANELEKTQGDTITVFTGDTQHDVTITGIYSDITNGGKTAKTSIPLDGTAMWGVINIMLNDPAQIDKLVKSYSLEFPFAKIVSLEEYMNQIFGNTVASIKTIATTSMCVAIALVLLITILSVRMFVEKDIQTIAVQRAIGFSRRDVSVQYLARVLTIMATALVIGGLLVVTCGQWLVGAFLSQLGAASVQINFHPMFVFVLVPAVLLSATVIASLVGTSAIKHMNVAERMKG